MRWRHTGIFRANIYISSLGSDNNKNCVSVCSRQEKTKVSDLGGDHLIQFVLCGTWEGQVTRMTKVNAHCLAVAVVVLVRHLICIYYQ